MAQGIVHGTEKGGGPKRAAGTHEVGRDQRRTAAEPGCSGVRLEAIGGAIERAKRGETERGSGALRGRKWGIESLA